jgi:hypothetical protein
LQSFCQAEYHFTMSEPESGDVLVREAAVGYVVMDAITLRELSGPCFSIADACTTARRLLPRARIWREIVDRRGRALGPPFLLELQSSSIA